jgi:outer membrane lipoprotein
MNYALSIMLTAALLTGCAPAISPDISRQAAPGVAFAELTARPEAYRGQTVIFGGEVMDVRPEGGGSLLRINQKELDAQKRPTDAPVSGGTFLVQSSAWLSPSEYTHRRKVVVAGTVEGKQDGLLLLKARQIHLWERPEQLDDFLRGWFGKDMEHWYTRPYFDPWRTSPR